ncbi:MAG: DUF1318 domain-containing protein [Kiloniellales bacterium]
MLKQRRFLLRLIGALLLAAALGATSALSPALAQNLDSLRASGAVGERFDGYAQARDASLSGYVQQVNQQRQQIYQQRAAEQGVPAEQVGRVYAKEIMAKAPKGTYFLNENNQWVQK